MTEKLRVCIVGGGIGGFGLAIGLSQHPNIKVDVYEVYEELKDIGKGIIISSNALEGLRMLGLHDKVMQMASVGNTSCAEEERFIFPDVRTGVGEKSELLYVHERFRDWITVHRSHYVQMLASSLSPEQTHLGKRFLDYDDTHDSHLTVRFQDTKSGKNSSIECDLLVGADGLKSAVRMQMLGKDYIRWTGVIAYRQLVDFEEQVKVNGRRIAAVPQCFTGESKHMITYAISNAAAINLILYTTDHSKPVGQRVCPVELEKPTSISKEEFAEHLKGWAPEARHFLEACDTVERWPMFELAPLPRITSSCKRVVLLGDSKHAQLPTAAVGAASAIEDASVLNGLLHDAASDPHIKLSDAIDAYVHARKGRGEANAARAREANELMQSPLQSNFVETWKALYAESWGFSCKENLLDARRFMASRS